MTGPTVSDEAVEAAAEAMRQHAGLRTPRPEIDLPIARAALAAGLRVELEALADKIEATCAQHELVVSGAYARCLCGVEFYFYERFPQYRKHEVERIVNTVRAAAGGAE